MISTAFKATVRCMPLALVLGTALFTSACGGGGSSAGVPSYGGDLVPGSVAMSVTNVVTITTNYGVINIGLDAAHAPISSANFLSYVKSGFFVGTLFHRVVPGFVVQGGGYSDVNGSYTLKATGASIALESRNGLSNLAYTLGMARSSDPNSANSQFYVNLVNNASSLDYPASDNAGYAVLGQILDPASINVINAIAQVPVATIVVSGASMSNWPVADVTIQAAVQTQ